MTLEESVDNLHQLESNGVTAYIDPTLKKYLEGQGSINIDHVKRDSGEGGYMVTVGTPGSSGSCGSGQFEC